ncbi:MAG: DUF4192 family protein [Micropruina sp.]
MTRVHHVDDMLGIIPHLLGFHPSESVVLVAVVDGIVELTARADLEDLLPAGHVELLIGRVLARFPQSLVWIVGYASDESSCTEVLIRGRDHLAGQPGVRADLRQRWALPGRRLGGVVLRSRPPPRAPRRRPCTAQKLGGAARTQPWAPRRPPSPIPGRGLRRRLPAVSAVSSEDRPLPCWQPSMRARTTRRLSTLGSWPGWVP